MPTPRMQSTCCLYRGRPAHHEVATLGAALLAMCSGKAEPCHVDFCGVCSAATCKLHGLLVQHLLLWLQLC